MAEIGARGYHLHMNLSCARVVGFFSLPPAALAESNPAAYCAAVQSAPSGAGTCAHCGTGIRNHIVIECGGVTAFIGTDCAARVGSDEVRECAANRKTSAQLERERAARAESDKARMDATAAQAAIRRERITANPELQNIAARLADGGGGFCDDVAAALRDGFTISDRQCSAVIDILSRQCGRRGSKAYNAEAERLARVLAI